jgi:predicted phage tail protein
MTTINIHGILAKEFGNCFYLKIRKAKDAILAINTNHSNFLKRITDLSKEGFHYAVIVDGVNIKDSLELEIKKIPMNVDIVPIICGSGIAVAAIGLIGITAAGAGMMGAGVAATIIGGLGAMALSIGVQMMLAPDPAKAGKAPRIEVGGVKESFLFGSKANLIEQGSPVPVGYGRLRVGSNVILTTVHSHPIKNTAEAKLRSSSVDSSLDTNQENAVTPNVAKKGIKSTAKVIKKTSSNSKSTRGGR